MCKKRCAWVDLKNELYVKYHDEEWGVPVHDDRVLFEMLCLEGAQAGLSWYTILKRRQNYKIAFDNFDTQNIIDYNAAKITELLNNPGIIRNKLKINSVINNARIFISIQQEFGSFDAYIWNFVDNKPINNHFKSLKELPTKTELSDKITQGLKKRGMKFIGSTIMYAYMQSIGMVNDHTVDCYRYMELQDL